MFLIFSLKMSIDGEDLMSVGELFHNFGTHTENMLCHQKLLFLPIWAP